MVRFERLTSLLVTAAFAVLSGCRTMPEPDNSSVEVVNQRSFDYPGMMSDTVRVPALLSLDDYFALWADSSDLVLIDMREEEVYLEGHIPGAFQLWRTDIESPYYPYEGMALSADSLADLVSLFGANPNTHFVVYDGVGGCDAARLWWLMRVYGHHKVSLIDGGWHAWRFSGYPAEQAETPLPKPGSFRFTHIPEKQLNTVYHDLVSLLNDTNTVVLDTRSYDEFAGYVLKNGASNVGHIPGSVHFDWGRSVEMKGSFPLRESNEIIAALAEVGVTPNKHIVTYCHSGVRSAHTTFVMKELLGFTSVSNYDGSWIEWSYLNQTGEYPIEKVDTL